MRKLIALGSLLALLSATVLLNLEYRVPALGARALAGANRASGLQLVATDFRLRPLHGLSVHDVSGRVRFPGGGYRLTIATLELDYRLAPLLKGVVSFERVTLERPRLEFSWDAVPAESTPPGRETSRVAGVSRNDPARSDPSSSTFPSSTSSPGPLDGFSTELDISELSFSDGTILLGPVGEETVRASLEGFAGTLSELHYDVRALTPFHGLDARGPVSFDSLRLDALQMEAAGGTVAMVDGILELSGFRFRTEDGTFQSDWRLNFNTIPFRYQANLNGALSGVNPLASGSASQQRGEASFQLAARGFGTDPSKLTGEGTLEIPGAFLRSSDLTRELDRVLDSSIVGASHEASQSNFTIADGRIVLEPLTLILPARVLVIAGGAELNGRLSMGLRLETPLASIDSAADIVARPHRERDDWVSLPFSLTGTLAEPQLILDPSQP